MCNKYYVNSTSVTLHNNNYNKQCCELEVVSDVSTVRYLHQGASCYLFSLQSSHKRCREEICNTRDAERKISHYQSIRKLAS